MNFLEFLEAEVEKRMDDKRFKEIISQSRYRAFRLLADLEDAEWCESRLQLRIALESAGSDLESMALEIYKEEG